MLTCRPETLLKSLGFRFVYTAAVAQKKRHCHAGMIAHHAFERAAESLAHTIPWVGNGGSLRCILNEHFLIGCNAEAQSLLKHPHPKIHVRFAGFSVRQIHTGGEVNSCTVKQLGRQFLVVK